MSNITPEVVAERIARFGKCYTIDDVVRLRAQDPEQTPILGIPRKKDDPADYEYFTGADLDRMIDESCRILVTKGLSVNSKKTVTIYAASDLSFCVIYFAIIRLGCKALTMSARLGPTACLSLLQAANSDVIIYGSSARIDSTLEEVARERPGVLLLPILTREEFDKPDAPVQPPFVREIADRDAEHAELAMMAHSSGSTGLPKPLLLSHRGVMSSLVTGTGLKAFNTLPWYHIHGLITSLQAMWMRRPAHLLNPHLPVTAANLVAALREIQPEICHGVPYALSLIAEDSAGVEVLKKCRYVTSAGARTPDELGDRLVKAGVNLGVLYGLSEVGHVGDSIGREPGQGESWAYMRPYANIREHILFKHVDGDKYETVYLKSHPALLMSNSNDPPGSYYSKDLFTPHPTIPDAWKYTARQDDRLTLITGEKILPLAMEGAVREHPLVNDALMFGNDRALPGMLVFRAKGAAAMTEDEFLNAIWPSVEQANSIADEFARITRETVASIAYGVEYPVTDKSNIIRAAAYALFAAQIDAIYARLDGSSSADSSSSLKPDGPLDEAKLTAFIIDVFKTQTGIELPTAQSDFFASGVDSLRAIQARRIFQETLGFGGFKLPTNVVYDSRNAANLAHFFHGLLQGTNATTNGTNGHTNDTNGSVAGQDDPTIMGDLASKYSTFSTEVPAEHVGGESVLLTGATGALGAHILYQLLHDQKVERVTCLVRGPHGLKRVHESLEARGLSIHAGRKLTRTLAVLETSNMGDEYLGLSPYDYHGLAADTTIIIHAAWPVHFGLSVSSFEPHIAGLHNLLQLSLQVPSRHPARVIFASSISTAFNVPRPASGEPASIPEGPLESHADCSPMGYAQSKFVGERICEAAARQGANVAVLRIGQITGDTEHGIWNDHEAIPLLVNSALELKALPLLGQEIGRCEWTPVDVVAASCIEIAEAMKGGSAVNGVNGTNGSNGVGSINGAGGSHKTNGVIDGDSSVKARYYNINTPHVLSWNDDVLPELQKAGLEFEAVSLDKWLEKLRARGEELGVKAAKRLPALKLADYYTESFADSDIVGIRFEIAKACHDSPTLGSCPNIAETQLVGKYLQSWLKMWTKN
ncbi:nrps-like enzyme [Ophiostoma piceae UAMH 11346]|uniref:Nrps-like enzyme n=1 Tax=Ophiostoma piceae (strain UAMH 11346) TaxID=1262450 RepID=S3CKD3_OPHP1|nr:nrps-like enzyme [Ophiostoma piceae UAMH 11346]